jgi:hypothetical protein
VHEGILTLHPSSRCASSDMSLSHSLSSTHSLPSTPSLSSTHSPSTTSLVASPGSSTQPHPDQRILVLGVTLGIIAFLLIGAIIFATVRMKHPKSGGDGSLRPARRTIIEPRHPASRVTPFGSPDSETPRFGYCEHVCLSHSSSC